MAPDCRAALLCSGVKPLPRLAALPALCGQPRPALPMCALARHTVSAPGDISTCTQHRCVRRKPLQGAEPHGSGPHGISILPKGARCALASMSTVGGSAWRTDECGYGHHSDCSETTGAQSHTVFPASPAQFLGRCQMQKCFPLAWLILTTLLCCRVA